MTKVLITMVVTLIFVLFGNLLAQNSLTVEDMVSIMGKSTPRGAYDAVRQLNKIVSNGDWNKLSPSQRDKLTLAFIHQLGKGKMIAEKSETVGTSDYVNLLGTIAGELKDVRMVPILINGIIVASYADALAKIGEPSIKPLIAKYEYSNENEKRSILDAFVNMNPDVIENNKKLIQNCVLTAGKDEEVSIRLSAMKVLGKLGDGDALPVIEEIVSNDIGYFDVNTASGPWNGYGSNKRYIVREEAAEALKTIKERINSQQLQPASTQTVATQ